MLDLCTQFWPFAYLYVHDDVSLKWKFGHEFVNNVCVYPSWANWGLLCCSSAWFIFPFFTSSFYSPFTKRNPRQIYVYLFIKVYILYIFFHFLVSLTCLNRPALTFKALNNCPYPEWLNCVKVSTRNIPTCKYKNQLINISSGYKHLGCSELFETIYSIWQIILSCHGPTWTFSVFSVTCLCSCVVFTCLFPTSNPCS